MKNYLFKRILGEKLINTFLFFLSIGIGTIGFSQTYCVPNSPEAWRVPFGIETTNGYTNFAIPYFEGEEFNIIYFDRTATHIVSQGANGSFDFSVTTEWYGDGNISARIWVDWNKDGDFDANELAFEGISTQANFGGNITVPLGTNDGDYRMRFVITAFDTNPIPCIDENYSEVSVEDYTLRVETLSDCLASSAISSSVSSSTSALVSWTTPLATPSAGYQYYYSTSNTNPTEGTTPSGSTDNETTSHEITGLTPNTTYYVWVRSNCGEDNLSEWTGPTSFYTGYCIPNYTNNTTIDPINFYTTGGETNIANTGNGNTDAYKDFTNLSATTNAGGEVNFFASYASPYMAKIWVDWNNDMNFDDEEEMMAKVNDLTTSFNETIYVPMDIEPGDYRMRIRIASNEEEDPSFDACSEDFQGKTDDYTLTVVELPLCTSPSNLQVSSSSATSGTINWTASVTAPNNGYDYYYSTSNTNPNAATIPSGNTAATSESIGDLTPNTTYYVWVRSNCAEDNQSEWIGGLSFTTLTSCQEPPILSANPTAYTATISWPAVTGAGWYAFRYKESTSGTWISAGTLTGTGTSKTLTGLTQSTQYDLQARTYCNSTSGSDWSETLQFTTIEPINCELPPVLSAVSTGTSVSISWPAVTGAGWYAFRYKEGNGAWISGGTATGTATTKTYTGLNPNTTYTFEAKSYCSDKISSNWDGIDISTKSLSGCELPPVISASNVTTNKITINWTSVSGAGWYEFRYKLASSNTWISAGTLVGSATSKTITGLTAGSLYDFQARTYCNSTSGSGWSNSLEVTTLGAAGLAQNNSGEFENTNLEELAVEGELELPSESVATSSEKAIEVVMYPNPTDNILNIDAVIESDNTAYLTVKVYDMSGRLVTGTSTLAGYGLNTIRLSLGDLNSGLYTIELYNNDQFVNRTRVQKK
ncbi:MAG: fibronectin type III domain-containing protein [Crocinitomicaceae bacterium]|nr:fibronectin type III domain-containing protein [Crocinitomicaceae bacterium]